MNLRAIIGALYPEGMPAISRWLRSERDDTTGKELSNVVIL
jgi:hypothetical protein